MGIGKNTCETLKKIHRRVAEANGIAYEPIECTQAESRAERIRKLNALLHGFSLLLLVLLMGSCGHQSGREEDSIGEGSDFVYEPPVWNIEEVAQLYYDFDQVPSLERFFDSLLVLDSLPQYHKDEEMMEPAYTLYHQSIHELERYRKGERKYYPKEEVREMIRLFSWNLEALESHSGDEVRFGLFEWYLRAAAFYCPDICFLAETHTEDFQFGLYNCGGEFSSNNDLAAYLLKKARKGYEVMRLPSASGFHRLFQLSDRQGRRYLLCSNNNTYAFAQALYLCHADGSISLVASDNHHVKTLEPLPQPDAEGYTHVRVDYQVSFLPDKREWRIGLMKNGQLQRVEDKGVMHLVLDGEKSRFELSSTQGWLCEDEAD